MKTFGAARDAHLKALADGGWTVRANLKIPHATAPDGVRIWFKPQAVYASAGTDFGAARSLHLDMRTCDTAAALIAHARELARAL